MRISFHLNQDDLVFFRREMRRARESLRLADDGEIVAAAREALHRLPGLSAPRFVKDSLIRLETLTAMLEDRDWALPPRERRRALEALAYFGDPEDLIADQVPGVGLLDDAIIAELVCRELRHEIEAFQDFDAFRSALRGAEDSGRDQRLARKRERLRARIRRRTEKDGVRVGS